MKAPASTARRDAPAADTPAAPTSLARRSRGRPSVEDVAAIEAEILQVALDQFVRHGYGVSMTGIIKAAGISKTTMYSRFASKGDLFRAIIAKQVAKVGETMPLGPPKGLYDLERGLKNYANRTLEVSLEREFLEVNRLIYSEAGRFPELGVTADERNRLGISQVSEFIRHRAEVDGIPCRDPDSVAEVFILLMRGWYTSAMLVENMAARTVREQWVDRAVKTLLSSRSDW